ncbi:sugar ABC transporter ATP-binding protein [Microbacterium schleiferi]|uniref:Sugar ABC transporter ATP-binding protein n=1 Tax=Microbacterium schleiferi TaxID=69362 RepID=A0A7S8MXA2_9MICO|nr:sugar ABC transporter ATP-binding protein [Microbacterium schleiferi]QPE04393.1 sugar ABC transporter ATP-binding protein [Microbacterium schleiferi]
MTDVTGSQEQAKEEVTAALSATEIVKRFDGVHALENARFSVRPGEIHALLGENGAGKSTLIKILTGVYQPDSGTIYRSGSPVRFENVREANHQGVVALYQELSIIPTLSVAENILLGEKSPSRAGIVQWRTLKQQARAQLDGMNQRNISVDALAADLSPVQQTMVAFARALALDAKVLILDEPTASLTDTEIVELFTVLRALRARGVAIVYVSHRLEEVFELCDRLTIMRNGTTIVTKAVADTHIDEVISLMVGRNANELYPARGTATDEVALTVSGVNGRRVKNVSLVARKGEVLGIGGLAGSGRSELLRILAGAQKHVNGEITVGEVTLPASPGVGRALAEGIALVPEERRSQGVILGASIQDNIAAANLPTVSSGGVVSGAKISTITKRGIADLKIKTRGPRQYVGELSGGNQQKVVLAKMLARKPKVLLMDEPTRGIDVGTKAEIYRLIRQLAAEGTAIIAISSELPELIGMSDRIIIMHEGEISGEVAADKADEELLLSYCYGKTEK